MICVFLFALILQVAFAQYDEPQWMEEMEFDDMERQSDVSTSPPTRGINHEIFPPHTTKSHQKNTIFSSKSHQPHHHRKNSGQFSPRKTNSISKTTKNPTKIFRHPGHQKEGGQASKMIEKSKTNFWEFRVPCTCFLLYNKLPTNNYISISIYLSFYGTFFFVYALLQRKKIYFLKFFISSSC